MWLTGFDCPPLHTMYLDKPLSGHNLMQAIARVNRVFGDKPGGVIVDYLGIADQLRDAIQTYTQAGGEGKPIERIQEEAVPVMQRQAEELATFFDGFDYAPLIRGSNSDQLRAIIDGANYVLGRESFVRTAPRIEVVSLIVLPSEPLRLWAMHIQDGKSQSIRLACCLRSLAFRHGGVRHDRAQPKGNRRTVNGDTGLKPIPAPYLPFAASPSDP
jgi:hypothetical protein